MKQRCMDRVNFRRIVVTVQRPDTAMESIDLKPEDSFALLPRRRHNALDMQIRSCSQISST